MCDDVDVELAEPFTVRLVTGRCGSVLRTGRHEVDWVAAQTADLTSFGLGAQTDAGITVSLARCRACTAVLLLIGPSYDEAAYRTTLEITGARTSDPHHTPR
jgi:hypothetical protein